MFVRKFVIAAAALAIAVQSAAAAATNKPILYPHDNSMRYAYGYSGFDWPIVYVQRGHTCNIVLEPGEMLGGADANSITLDDRSQWLYIASRSGGQRSGDTSTIVPITWTVGVVPTQYAKDAWLTIHSALGRHYLIHLVPVGTTSALGQHLIGFYYWHPPTFKYPERRQATTQTSSTQTSATVPATGPTPDPAMNAVIKKKRK